MTSHVRAVAFVWALVAALAVADVASGQTRWNSGQNVQPVFEGWKRNPDGTFSMVFGYLNRNYQEQPHVPVGSHNFFDPGDADRRQPTHFYNRRQSFVFEVQVPADWGDKDLIWTVTHNGRTDRAHGSLWPVWEIDEAVLRANRGMGVGGAYVDNNPPTIQIASGETDTTVTLPDAATLTALAGDDGAACCGRRHRPDHGRRCDGDRQPGFAVAPTTPVRLDAADPTMARLKPRPTWRAGRGGPET